MQGREEIQFEEAARVVQRGAGGAVVRPATGIIDERVDPAKAGHRLFNQGHPIFGHSQIARNYQILRSADRPQPAFIPPGEHEPRTHGAKLRREFCANAIGRACDDNNGTLCFQALCLQAGNAIIALLDNTDMSRLHSGKLLPLFPLQLVAFPGSAIPLHIFEPRYREMVGEAEALGTEFGIVLSRDGGIVNAGCTVVVESVMERYPDGRFDVMTRGMRRFSLLSVNEDLEYLRGEVEFFDDVDRTEPNPALRQRAIAAWERMRESPDGDPGTEPEPEPEADDPHLSFQLAQAIEDLDFQNLILRTRSETERLQQFLDVIEPYLEKRRYREVMRKLAPTNGHGHKPAGM